jgi:hypothetical protein
MKNIAPNGYYCISAEGCHTLSDHSVELFAGQEGPKGSKGTLRPNFQANTRPRIFLKPMSPIIYRKTVVRKSRHCKLKTILRS